jgi:hypothetical protein
MPSEKKEMPMPIFGPDIFIFLNGNLLNDFGNGK